MEVAAIRNLALAFLLISAASVQAVTSKPKPLGLPGAPKGGDFVYHRPTEPYSLNPIITDGHDSVDIQFHIIEPLLLSDSDTYDWIPVLAHKWRILPDGKTYEFEIRPNAMWSDGRPVTAEDVKFSFDVLFNDAFPTAHMRPYYEGIERVEVVSKRVVRFHAKNTYFGNFISSAGIPVVPKHIYNDSVKGPQIHHDLIGSGPYMIERWQKGIRLVLKRNPKWWGLKDPLYKNAYNPDRVIFRFLANEQMAMEMLKRGEIDFMGLSADAYMKRTNSASWGTRAFKVKIANEYPKGSQYIAWNLERAIFQDRDVRLALALLMDREMMVKKFDFGLTIPASGPWYQQSIFADPEVKPLPFDPVKALAMLNEAGWSDTDGDGVLDKMINGMRTPLAFTILLPNKGAERFLTVYQQDAKRAGVDVKLKFVDWSVLGSILDRRDYDAVQMDGGGGLVDFDPKPMWHSESIKPGGNNFSGYRNPEVDALIDQARNTPERAKRIPLMRRIYRILAEDAPALFLFNSKYDFYAHSARVGKPVDTYRYDVGTKYWWVKR